MDLNEAIEYAKENGLHPDIIKYLINYKTMVEELINRSENQINQLKYELWETEYLISCKQNWRKTNGAGGYYTIEYWIRQRNYGIHFEKIPGEEIWCEV